MIAKPARPPKEPLWAYDFAYLDPEHSLLVVLREDLHPRSSRPRLGGRVVVHTLHNGTIRGTIARIRERGVTIIREPADHDAARGAGE